MFCPDFLASIGCFFNSDSNVNLFVQIQDDDAKDDDIHNSVCSKLEKNFAKRSKQPAIAVLAVSATKRGCNYTIQFN